MSEFRAAAPVIRRLRIVVLRVDTGLGRDLCLALCATGVRRRGPARLLGARGRPPVLDGPVGALAVYRDDQHVAAGARRGPPLGVESVEINRRPLGEFFDPPFAHPHPGDPLHRVAGVVERAPRRFPRTWREGAPQDHPGPQTPR